MSTSNRSRRLSRRALLGAAAAVVAASVLSGPPAAAVGGEGERASAAPIRLQAGLVDLKITLLGLVDVPVRTTLVSTTDLKITQTTPDETSYVPVGGAPTLVDGVYQVAGTSVPMLESCSPQVFSASSAYPVHAQVWGSGGLSYGLDLVRFDVLGSCGGAAHAFTQRVQWGSGSAAEQVLAAQSQVTGLAVGLPAALVPEVPGRTVLAADVLSSRAACPSTSSLEPASALIVSGLEVLGALGVSVGADGQLLALTRPDGSGVPLVSAVGVDIGVPGLLADVTVGGDALVELRIGLSASDLTGTLLEPVPSLLDGLLGLDADLVVTVDSEQATAPAEGSASAAALRAVASLQLGLDVLGVLTITDTTGTKDGEVVVADVGLGTTSCTWPATGADDSWLDPTLT